MAVTGRPTTYTQELADDICAELADGRSLRSICREEDMPAASTVFKWLRENKEFSEQYARAKEESADALIEDIIDIADDGTNDYSTRENSNGEEYEVVNHENIQRSRLRVEARKWAASKLKPKKYGDKLDVTTKGESINAATLLFNDDKPIDTDTGTEEDT